MRTDPKRPRLIGLALALIVANAAAPEGRYMEQEAFLEAVFADSNFAEASVFVDAPLRESIEALLGHRLSLLRVRYWRGGSTTAWIIDEIGKEEPITIGVGVDNGAVDIVRIIEFRESRGSEVRYPFFTDRFTGARLREDASIDRRVDGITGATLSVGAVNRVVRLALFLHGQVEGRSEQAASRP